MSPTTRAWSASPSSVGSMTFTGSLSHNNYDNNVSRIMRNVIDGFLAEGPLP